MIGSYSPFWIFFFIFHMLICLFGIFSQFVFMRTTVWDKKIAFNCRVYLFFLSLGYQTMLVAFVAITLTCLYTVGSLFEVAGCSQATMLFLTIRNLGEFEVVFFHLLINFDRLDLAFRPGVSRGRAAKVYFYVSCLVSIALGLIYTESLQHGGIRVYIALACITSINVLNLLIEVKLFHYTDFAFKNTIGRVPLERRFELSTSVTMVRCFLPASVGGLFSRFTGIIFFFLIFMRPDSSDFPPLVFVMEFFFNLECVVFPWFFILFHPNKRDKLKRFLRIQSPPALHDQNLKKLAPQTQQEHFDSFKILWRVRI